MDGNAYAELAKQGMDLYAGSENRKLTRRQIKNQEEQAKFNRLLSLIDVGQGTQDRYAAGSRLLSLRNTGSR